MRSPRPCEWLAALLAAAISCAEPESRPPEASAAPRSLAKVRMNLLSTMTWAPAVIAQEEGFFEDEGIDIEFVTVDANSALLALSSGSLDVIGNPIRSGLFNLIARGVPFQIVADDGHSEPGPCAPEAFTAPPDLVKRVRRSGLRGQRVAMIKGGITEFLVTRLLETHGLTTADVQLVEYPAGEAATGEFRVFDAVRYSFEPSLTVQTEQGLIEVLSTSEEVAPGHQRNVLGFGARFLHEDPELGRRFMRAWLRGVRRYNEGKTDRNVAIISGYTNLPAALVRKVCWPRISGDGRIRPEAVQPLLDWMRERGYLDADMPLPAWWNPGFVDAANRDLARQGVPSSEMTR